MADKVMIKALTDPATEDKRPMIVFLSNGRNNGGGDALQYVNEINEEDPRMILHKVMFGICPTINILVEMANIGNITFQQC